MKRRLIVIIAAFATAFAALPAGAAPDRVTDRALPDSIESLKLDELVDREIYEFAFIVEPLKLRGATGSAIAPIAVH